MLLGFVASVGDYRYMPKPTIGASQTLQNGRKRTPRPLGPQPHKVPATAKSPARLRLERVSIKPLTVLNRLPRFILPLLLGIFLLAGLLIPSQWAGLFLLLVGVALAWLVALSWPAIVTSAKIVRVVVIAIVLFAAVWRLAGLG